MDTGVRFFTSIVKLDSVTDELKPGMTTMVDFALSRRKDVLAIPHEAVRTDRGKKSATSPTMKTSSGAWSKSARIRPRWSKSSMVCRKAKWSLSILLESTVHVEQLLSFDDVEPSLPAETDS